VTIREYHWSVHSSLVGSLVVGDARYALNEGEWYRLDDAFKQAADDNFRRLLVKPDPVLIPLQKYAGQKGKGKRVKVRYQTES
jgi:uncharacterized protein (TIGR04141 family)